jgi:hypothetical protein
MSSRGVDIAMAGVVALCGALAIGMTVGADRDWEKIKRETDASFATHRAALEQRDPSKTPKN